MERLIDARSEDGEHPSPSFVLVFLFLRARDHVSRRLLSSFALLPRYHPRFRAFIPNFPTLALRTPNVFSFVRSFVSRLARYRDSLEGVHVTNHRKRKENKRKEIEEKNAKVLGRVPIALCSGFRVDRGRESVEEQTRERESIDPTL